MLTRTIFAVVLFAVLKCCHAQPLPTISILPPAVAPNPPTVVMEFFSSLHVTNSSNISPPNNADSVKAWGDNSGNGNHLQKLAGPRPLYYGNGGGGPAVNPNGNPYIAFGLPAISSAVALTNTTAGNHVQTNTFIFVFADLAPITNSAGGANGVLYNEGNGQNSQMLKAQTGGGPWWYHLYSGTDVNFSSPLGSNAWDGNWHVVVFQHSGATSRVRVDGVTKASNLNIGTGGCNGITLCNYFNLSNGNWAGCIAYFGWFTGRAYSDIEIHSKEVTLGSIYGITIN